MLNYHKADEGKVWIHKATGSILSSELYLGNEDSKDNYEQVEVLDEQQPNNTGE